MRHPGSRWPSANFKSAGLTRRAAGALQSSGPACRSARCGAGSWRARRGGSWKRMRRRAPWASSFPTTSARPSATS
eukprot:10036583-Alexandrium_andersonii.AAC.1